MRNRPFTAEVRNLNERQFLDHSQPTFEAA